MRHSNPHQQPPAVDVKPARDSTRKRRVRAIRLSVLLFVVVTIWQGSAFWQRICVNQIRLATAELRWEDAQTWLDRLRWFVPNSTEALLAEARLWRKRGSLDKARDRLQRAHALGHSRDKLQHEEWLIQAQSGELSEAEGPLLKALQAEYDVRETLDALTQGYLRSGQYAKADASLNTWQTILPKDSRPLVLRGQLLLQLMDWTKAVAELRHALRRNPDDQDAALLLAEALLATHYPAEATELFYRCHQIWPERPSVTVGLSRAMIANGKSEDAVALLKPILQRHPNLVEARQALGEAFINSGRADEAIELLQPAVQSNPNHPAIRYTLGSALRFAGRIEEAEPHLVFAREANQQLQEAQRLRKSVWEHPKAHAEKLELAQLLLKFHQVEEATMWLRNLLADQPRHAEANLLLEECRRRQ